ncbi:MAG: flavodoxin family protein [Clostridiales bacterium]|nr:flavodoxin family protein [Clostridiales bacterium]
MMVLMINGSSREKGCTFTALSEIAEVLHGEWIETEILQIGSKPVRDCIGCGGCRGKHHCVFNDDFINEWIDKAKEADGFVFGTPVYYAHPSGKVLSALDRLFYAGGGAFAHKPGAVIASARRAGTTASLDALSKHLTIAQMPVISSTYWNMVHGNSPEEVKQDLEGLQTMRNLGRNMAWILKCIQAGKEAGINAPDVEKGTRTNFIR